MMLRLEFFMLTRLMKFVCTGYIVSRSYLTIDGATDNNHAAHA